jgi:hypothetical protein
MSNGAARDAAILLPVYQPVTCFLLCAMLEVTEDMEFIRMWVSDQKDGVRKVSKLETSVFELVASVGVKV